MWVCPRRKSDESGITNLRRTAIPTYVYACDNCVIEFEHIQGINDLACADCPECLKVTNRRIPQRITVIDKTPKTLGALADQKRNQMGKYAYDDTVQKMANERHAEFCGKLPEGTEQIQPSTERPFWRKDMATPDYKILKASPEKINDYVMTGNRPFGTT